MQTAPQKLWLVFGGNGDVALAWMRLLRAFPDPRSGFLLIDYPGYGLCPGNPNPETILETSQGALQALLKSKDWKMGADSLCVLGHSLGGAAALQFAAENPVRKVVIISTFTTMDDMVRRQIRIPLGRLLRHRFDNVASLNELLSQKDVPEICLFHGEADEIIPAKMGRALASLDPLRIKFYAIPGARHNDVFQLPLSASLRAALFDPVARW